MWKYISNSTLKREFATALVLWLFSEASYMIATAPTFENKLQVLTIFAWPILFGAYGVFGLDWISKQTTIAGPPMNTETTVKTETTDDSTTLTTKSEPTT